MIWLCLAVLSSSMVSVVMRLGTRRVKDNIGMLSVNYIVCALLAAICGGLKGAFDLSGAGEGLTLMMGLINGGFYLAGFVLMQMNIQKNGVVLSSIFQKLGLLVTLTVSVVFYREVPDLKQCLGFVLAIMAIWLMNYQPVSGTARGVIWLIAMLLACGMADAMSKIFMESGQMALEDRFLFYTFAMAMLLCLVVMVLKGQKIGAKEMLFGTVIAVPNFFSSKFLLGALEGLSAVVVYPVFSVGTILVVTMTGVVAFRERLSKLQWLAVAVILTALVLLNI